MLALIALDTSKLHSRRSFGGGALDRYHLHLKIAGRRVPDPHGFEAETEAAAIARARDRFADLVASEFLSPLSVELETAAGRSLLLLFSNGAPARNK